MSGRVVRVEVPNPYTVGRGGPEWRLRGVYGDYVCLTGIPAGENAPATVELYVVEDVAPFHEAIGYLSPETARQVAGALIGAAEHAEGRWS